MFSFLEICDLVPFFLYMMKNNFHRPENYTSLMIHHSKQYKCWVLTNFLVSCYSLMAWLTDFLCVSTFRNISSVHMTILTLIGWAKTIWHNLGFHLNAINSFHSPSCQFSLNDGEGINNVPANDPSKTHCFTNWIIIRHIVLMSC